MDLVEAVARALCALSFDGQDPDGYTRKAGENPCPRIPLQEDERDEFVDGEYLLCLKNWRLFVPAARVVIPVVLEWLKEPTKQMIEAGIEVAEEIEDWTSDTETSYRLDTPSQYPMPIWQAMIAAAAIRGEGS